MGSIFRSSSSSCLLRAVAKLASGPKPPPLRVPTECPSAPRVFLRSPLETSSFCLESPLPMHSATASVLMKSMLSPSRGSWLRQGNFYAFMTVAFLLVDAVLVTVSLITGTLVHFFQL